ncbi:SRPBCC domain-containing protein [uncultured Psychroserpens sp.]|uniref:SRPBCC domain-containing protein n=1 Tax=uncultured Psychroserpens sp. TaxID=255436 RepID=UPI002622A036|nr:SRPBCC domain-containing protein [uncultured Psychroserpens sp.]
MGTLFVSKKAIVMSKSIKWKLNLKSTPNKVFQFITTDEGRKLFWAENTIEEEGQIHFEFINGVKEVAKIMEFVPNKKMSLRYFESNVTFFLEKNKSQGTDLTLLNTKVNEEEYIEIYAGWISVLFALKGAIDFGVDLRNHNPNKTWNQLYIEN